eukprot:4709219-Prymnesium_polylepis.1
MGAAAGEGAAVRRVAPHVLRMCFACASRVRHACSTCVQRVRAARAFGACVRRDATHRRPFSRRSTHL